MEKFAKYGASIVIAHTIIVALHGLAHEALPVPISLFQSLFVGIVIIFVAGLAALLLWTPFSRMGAVLLLGSMVGSLTFGLYNHFILVSADHVSRIPFTGWGILFQVTAVLLAIMEGLGIGVSIWGLKQIPQAP